MMRCTVSFKAMQRSRTTVEDFVLSYFPYHKLQTDDFLKYLDVLVWVEATIYQLDEENELDLSSEKCHPNLRSANDVICPPLRELTVLDDRIDDELKEGEEYWRLERSICREMLMHADALSSLPAFTLDEVIRAHEVKSFDYRVLHLLLHRLLKVPYKEDLLAFTKVDELLVDIGDDLYDYEDDVAANSFNIYRAFIHLFKGEAQLKLVERISELESRHSTLLAALPEEWQQHYWSRHKEAAAEKGAEKWVFPTPIYDEAKFREEHS